MDSGKAKILLPIITALAENKAIQVRNSRGVWVDVVGPDFSSHPDDYRIKPEPKVRPFRDAADAEYAILMFRWVRMKNRDRVGDMREAITAFSNTGCWFAGAATLTRWHELLEKYEFVNGKPCGVEEGGPFE